MDQRQFCVALIGALIITSLASGEFVAPEVHPGYPNTPREAAVLPPFDAPVYVLPPPDLAAAKTRPLASPGIERIGVVQETPELFGVDHGTWTMLPSNDWFWAVTFHAPGATGLRIHLSALELPDGASALLVSSDGVSLEVSEAGWSPTAFGDEATLVCVLPGGEHEDEFFVAVDQTAYLFADWAALAKGSGECNIDVPCEPDWETPAMGVGGIGTIGGADAIWCTGSLIADSVPETNVPWFLTANHCISNQDAASSIEVFWQYDAFFCGGNAPDLASVPRTTGGATYVAGSTLNAGTDVTLLHLRQQPPAGLVWLGWTTTVPDLGTEVVSVHHPSGDSKKISIGQVTDAGSPSADGEPLLSGERYHEVLWNAGTTEGGSSGSPLLLPSGIIVGQLWGGRASCAQLDEPDYYGRFDQSYPLLANFLGPPRGGVFDLDKNGTVNSADLQIVINAALNDAGLLDADLNDSGRVDAADVEATLRAMLSAG